MHILKALDMAEGHVQRFRDLSALLTPPFKKNLRHRCDRYLTITAVYPMNFILCIALYALSSMVYILCIVVHAYCIACIVFIDFYTMYSTTCIQNIMIYLYFICIKGLVYMYLFSAHFILFICISISILSISIV